MTVDMVSTAEITQRPLMRQIHPLIHLKYREAGRLGQYYGY